MHEQHSTWRKPPTPPPWMDASPMGLGDTPPELVRLNSAEKLAPLLPKKLLYSKCMRVADLLHGAGRIGGCYNLRAGYTCCQDRHALRVTVCSSSDLDIPKCPGKL